MTAARDDGALDQGGRGGGSETGLGSAFTPTIQPVEWARKEGVGALASVTTRMELPLEETEKTTREASVVEEDQGLRFEHTRFKIKKKKTPIFTETGGKYPIHKVPMNQFP